MTIKEFYEKVANDSELQAKVAEAAKSGKTLDVVLKELGMEIYGEPCYNAFTVTKQQIHNGVESG